VVGSQSLAAEAPEKVRVNCIQPGVVEGERIERGSRRRQKALAVDRKKSADGGWKAELHTTVHAQDIANHGAVPRHRSRQAQSPPGDLGLTAGAATCVEIRDRPHYAAAQGKVIITCR